MKLFIIEKGTEVMLMSHDNCKRKSVISKCDATFEVEDIITDPVSYVNGLIKQQRDNNKVETNTNEFLSQVLTKGFFIFKLKKGVHTNTDFKYLYVVSEKVKQL